MRDNAKGVLVTPALYATPVGLLLWMTVPLGLKGLIDYGSLTSATLLAVGIVAAILATVPGVRKRILGRRLRRANAIFLAVVLILVGFLEVVNLMNLGDFAAFGLTFEIVDKIILLALLGLCSVELLIGAARPSS